MLGTAPSYPHFTERDIEAHRVKVTQTQPMLLTAALPSGPQPSIPFFPALTPALSPLPRQCF